MQAEADRVSTASVGVLQPYSEGPRVAGMGGGSPRLSKEVFGFALGSSLSDGSLGYPSWNFDLLTTVAYFGLHVDWDGTFANDSGWAVWNSSQLSGLVSTAHAHGTKVVLTIVQGDARSTFPNTMCNSLSNAPTAVSRTVAEVKAKGVDGVNIDYEGVNQSCGQSDPSWARHALTSFVQQMRAGLGSGYYLSIDTYSGAAGDPYDFFDIGGLNPYVDSFFVMTYDMEYSNWHHPPVNCGNFCMGPTSPLTAYYYNDTDVMAQYSATVSASKVILGVPYYGRKACVSPAIANEHPIGGVIADMYVNAAGEATDPSVRAGSYAAHRDAFDLAGQERWDTWYSTSAACSRELYWDDVQSLGLKYDLINRDGLRGAGIWNLNYGGGSPELWATLASHFGGWAASYDMSKAPSGWGVKQTQTFPVTITNTGTMVWPSAGYNEVDLDLHFASSAGGFLNQSAWATSQAFSLPFGDVGPGRSITMNVTVTAPSSAGSFVLEAEMIKEHDFWFTQFQPFNVSVSAWVASYDMSQVPTSWSSGQSQNVRVTVTNAGAVTWPSTGYTAVDLDLHFATSSGGATNQQAWLNSKAFSLPADLAPGASVTLNVRFEAPATSGSMVLEAEMIKEHQFWFAQVASVTVTVAGPTWSASYDMSKVPTSWATGQSQTFAVTVTNTGNQTWPSTGYTEVDIDLHFATSTGGSANQANWTYSQALPLGADVAPSGSATVTFTLTAPAGSTVLEALMIKEHQFWFRQWGPVNVTVATASWTASYDMSKAPRTWTLGQSQTFPVTVTNTGNQTWPSTGYYAVDLDLHFTTLAGGSAQQASWLTSQALSTLQDVAPGQSATVTFTLTPPRTGVYVLEAEMIKEHQFWFQQSAPVTVAAAPAGWSASYDMGKAPTSWVAGKSQTFSVTVTNNGTQAWPSTGYFEVDLDLHFATSWGGATNQASWVTSAAFSLPRDVAPGQSVTVQVTITPPRSGSFMLEAEMIREHQFWFLQSSAMNVQVA